jgi:hypothetical protein
MERMIEGINILKVGVRLMGPSKPLIRLTVYVHQEWSSIFCTARALNLFIARYTR